MRVRWVVVRANARARMATVLCSIVTLFAALAVSACTGSSGSPNAGGSASSTFFTAKAPGSGTATATPASGLPTTTPATVPPTTVPPTTVAPTTVAPTTVPPTTPSPSPSATVAPIGAPSTGGGGTAGLQHVMLFGLGGLAVLAGLASLIYRKRALRDR